jgi:hypothetical protein
MANNIGWGQGALNNDIGWGQGAINNNIFWGSIYDDSYSGETDIIGNPITNIITDFKARVSADNGLFEAESCLITTITNLNNIEYIEPLILNELSVSSNASFSLRKLNNNYTGFAISVRRSSDNTEMNIGFVDNELDTTALLTFCGASSGFVTTWYGQSGNGINAVQATAANQPRIVLNGVLDIRNNKPTLVSTNSTTFLQGTLNINGLTGLTLNAVGINPNTGTAVDNRPSFFAWSEQGSWGKTFLTSNQTQIAWRFGSGQVGNNRNVSVAINPNLATFNLIKNSTTETPFYNGVALTPFTGALPALANNSSTFKLMSGESGLSVVGLSLSEALVFPSALSLSDRTILQQNQISNYGIS